MFKIKSDKLFEINLKSLAYAITCVNMVQIEFNKIINIYNLNI